MVRKRKIDGRYIFHEGRNDCFEYVLPYEEDAEIENCAQHSLEYYNNKFHTDYKFVRPMRMSCTVRDHFTIHCSYTAEPVEKPLTSGDFSKKVFFAALEYHGDFDYRTTYCCMITGMESTRGCSMCPNMIDHPTGVFPEDNYEKPTFFPRRSRGACEYSGTSDNSCEDNSISHLVDSTRKVLGTMGETHGDSLSPKEPEDCTKASARRYDTFELSLEDEHWIQGDSYAEKALAYYNVKSGTHYQYVELLEVLCSMEDSLWVFCKFTAEDGTSIKLFFAELEEVGDGAFSVTACRMLNGKSSKIKHGCQIPPHASSGYYGSHDSYHSDEIPFPPPLAGSRIKHGSQIPPHTRSGYHGGPHSYQPDEIPPRRL